MEHGDVQRACGQHDDRVRCVRKRVLNGAPVGAVCFYVRTDQPTQWYERHAFFDGLQLRVQCRAGTVLHRDRAVLDVCRFDPRQRPGDDNRTVYSCLKMLEIVLDHGICLHAPYAFFAYGFTLAHLGNVADAYKFGESAMKLLDTRPGMAVVRAKHAVGMYAFLWHLENPMHVCLELSLEISEFGLRNRDSYNACYFLRHASGMGIFAGRSLCTFQA